jgi:hypothetical protein
VVVLVVGTNANPQHCCNFDVMVSTQVPSRFTREILSVQLSHQYNLLEKRSSAKPVGERTPAFDLLSKVSVIRVIRLWRLTVLVPESVQ